MADIEIITETVVTETGEETVQVSNEQEVYDAITQNNPSRGKESCDDIRNGKEVDWCA